MSKPKFRAGVVKDQYGRFFWVLELDGIRVARSIRTFLAFPEAKIELEWALSKLGFETKCPAKS